MPIHVSAIIPALDEEEAIGPVVQAVLQQGLDEVIVVDNGSRDLTAARARAAGARVVAEPRRGYGRACQAGVGALAPNCDIVVFLDGDGSDCPELMARLVGPIQTGDKDFVIGSRIRGQREPGSMNGSQILAGRLAGMLIRLRHGVVFTDMCPFRAIRRDALLRLGMSEPTYGWNLEMQMRAAEQGLRILEVPVDHRARRGGRSKVSGNPIASLRAAWRIAWTFLRLTLDLRRAG